MEVSQKNSFNVECKNLWKIFSLKVEYVKISQEGFFNSNLNLIAVFAVFPDCGPQIKDNNKGGVMALPPIPLIAGRAPTRIGR